MYSSIHTSLRTCNPNIGLSGDKHVGDMSPEAKEDIIGAAILGLGVGGLIFYTLYKIFHLVFQDPAKKAEQIEMRCQAAVADIEEKQNGERLLPFMMSTGEQITYVEQEMEDEDLIESRIHQPVNNKEKPRAVYLIQNGEKRLIEYFKYTNDEKNFLVAKKAAEEKDTHQHVSNETLKNLNRYKSTFQSLEQFQQFCRKDIAKNKDLLWNKGWFYFLKPFSCVSRKINLWINLSEHEGSVFSKSDLEEMQELYDLKREDIEAAFTSLSAHGTHTYSYSDFEDEYDAKVKKHMAGKYKDIPDSVQMKCKEEMRFYKLNGRFGALNIDGMQFLDQAIWHRKQRYLAEQKREERWITTEISAAKSPTLVLDEVNNATIRT